MKATASVDDLSALGVPYGRALSSLYAGEPQRGVDGRPHEIDETTRISIAEGMTLFSLCVADRVASTLEVGLAYGFSTAFLLAALEATGGGVHTAIDPFQLTDWHGIGITRAAELTGTSAVLTPGSFRWIEARSGPALIDLERAGSIFGLTFIDGYHRFDDVLVDFTLSARMCPPGGLIVLHDMWLHSVTAVASFIRHDRPDFAEVPTACENVFVVRRVGEDERDWTHFVDFPLR